MIDLQLFREEPTGTIISCRETQQLRDDVRQSAEVQFVLQVYSALNSNNYIRLVFVLYQSKFLSKGLLQLCSRIFFKCQSERSELELLFLLREVCFYSGHRHSLCRRWGWGAAFCFMIGRGEAPF